MQGKLNEAEYTACKVLLKASELKAVLNEKPPSRTQMVELPEPVGGCTVPTDDLASSPHRFSCFCKGGSSGSDEQHSLGHPLDDDSNRAWALAPCKARSGKEEVIAKWRMWFVWES